MHEQPLTLDVSTMSDQWITDRYCKELFKEKALRHFRGRIDVGQPDLALQQRCRQELKRRGLIVPRINFRVRVS